MSNLNECGKYRISVVEEHEIQLKSDYLNAIPIDIQFGGDIVSETIVAVMAAISQCPEIREALERCEPKPVAFYEAYDGVLSSLEARQKLGKETIENFHYEVKLNECALLLNQRIKEFVGSALKLANKNGVQVVFRNPENNFRGVHDFLTTIDNYLVGIEIVLVSNVHILRRVLIRDVETKGGFRLVWDNLWGKLFDPNLNTWDCSGVHKLI